MNKFFILIYVFIIVICMGNLQARFDISEKNYANVKNIICSRWTKAACSGVIGYYAGNASGDQLSAISGAFCATMTSLIVSEFDYYVPDKIRKIIADRLPEQFPTEEAKFISHMLVAFVIGNRCDFSLESIIDGKGSKKLLNRYCAESIAEAATDPNIIIMYM